MDHVNDDWSRRKRWTRRHMGKQIRFETDLELQLLSMLGIVPNGENPEPDKSLEASETEYDNDKRFLKIEFCSPGQLRMRKVVNRSNARPTSKFPSVKEGRMIEADAEGELSVIRTAECDPEVLRFGEQPCEIDYLDGETERSHIPDLRVSLEAGEKELWENKRRAGITSEVKELTSFLETALPQHGHSYRLKVAEEAETQPAKRNRELITYFGYRPVDLREREIVRLLCVKNGSISWGEAHNGVCGKFGRHILCRLFIEGMLTFNLDQPLSLETRFYLRKKVV